MVLLGQNWLHTSHMSVEKSYKGSFTTFRFIVSIFAKTRHSSNVALYCLTKPAALSGSVSVVSAIVAVQRWSL